MLNQSQEVVHELTRITRTKLREKKARDGRVRVVNEVVRKRCRHCWQSKRRSGTHFECPACEGWPGYCTTCFCEVQLASNTPYSMNLNATE